MKEVFKRDIMIFVTGCNLNRRIEVQNVDKCFVREFKGAGLEDAVFARMGSEEMLKDDDDVVPFADKDGIVRLKVVGKNDNTPPLKEQQVSINLRAQWEHHGRIVVAKTMEDLVATAEKETGTVNPLLVLSVGNSRILLDVAPRTFLCSIQHVHNGCVVFVHSKKSISELGDAVIRDGCAVLTHDSTARTAEISDRISVR